MIPARLYLSDTKASSAPLQRAVPPELRPGRTPSGTGMPPDRSSPTGNRQRRTHSSAIRAYSRQAAPPSTAPSPSVQRTAPRKKRSGIRRNERILRPEPKSPPSDPGSGKMRPAHAEFLPRPAFLPSDRLPADALQVLVRAAEMAAAEKSPIGRQGRRVDRLENAVALRIDNRSLALRIRAP